MRINAGDGDVSSQQRPSLCGGEDEPPPLSALPVTVTEAGPSICRHERWTDWRWQMAHRIRRPEQLFEYFPNLQAYPDLAPVIGKYPMAITPYYASLIRRAGYLRPHFPDVRAAVAGTGGPAVPEPGPAGGMPRHARPGDGSPLSGPCAGHRHDDVLDLLPALHAQAHRRHAREQHQSAQARAGRRVPRRSIPRSAT